MRSRKYIVLTARVHPGETNSSFKMHGCIKFLIGDSERAKYLRALYVFKIVPMLNPDGVVCGNYRSSFSGVDLNRRWIDPDPLLHPSVFALKQIMISIAKIQRREILVFCDLHGHSKKLNSFMYGCNTAANGGFCSWTKVRLLPKIMMNESKYFNYNDCRFKV